MATSKGNNSRTGAATPAESDVRDAEAKTAKAKAKASNAEAAKLDRKVIGALKAAEKSVVNLSTAIDAARQANVHRFTVNAETGKPFTSFAAYLRARSAEFPLMHRILRKAVVADMLAHGASVREMAAVAQASVGTIAGDVAEAEGRAARPGGSAGGTAPEAGTKAAKAAKALRTAATRASDAVADMTDDDLASVAKAAADLASVTEATVKLRAEAASKAKAKASSARATAKAATPKPSPAPVAATA